MESPLALYRRYRPETFAEVIGQEHVTEPLRAALANNRVNHAYLFSGPRGCGKTTSARILARALNCEQAPVADPCGECDSCRDLARGGPGSIDVIEIDAASHGGVDDARDLREKAFFAPVRSKYKVYIIDEAHMVTTQGFNALLKLVEEPPPHLRFIFATTEPDKVLPTIRSRTHHYPFRLIPPRLLSSYLSELCDKEGVSIETAAVPLVVRAGAGSARDTLSVLDQLLGGAGPAGVTYDLATGLLGYTPDTLLDDVVDAFAAGDGAAVFGVVDKVVETGQDPRRFTEDLLRRLRDLVIVAAVPDAPATGLIDVSEDQGERLVAQAARFGPAELSRAADIIATGLTEMRGATAPRLLLELLCARVLLPGADHATDGVLARLDRLEKRLTISGTPSPVVAPPAPPAQDRPVAAPSRPAAPDPAAERPEPAHPPAHPPTPEPEPVVEQPASAIPEPEPEPEPVAAAPAPEPTPSPVAEPAAAVAPAAAGGLTLVDVRRLWPDIVDATKLRRRVAWMHLTQNCQVVAVDATTLTLGFANAGARESFVNGGCDDVLRQAAIDVVGATWKIDTIVDPGAKAEGTPTVTRAAVAAPEAQPDASTGREAGGPVGEQPAPAAPVEPEASRRTSDPESIAAAREAIQQTRSGDQTRSDDRPDWAAADADARPDDLDADHQGLSTAELLKRELGAQMIEEIRNL
ncbi:MULTISPECIES: DNA polymerase III subunit gamma and tau [unclassified Nocardioides]|uniref:DNA polymerase III subunit gamma and tau n=1 Tax=unclassified Nocardioides TaxID=2615069 RepID=UPI0009F06846|nr:MULTISPECIES: DNA polymerase III subunit gamma and tau [unclassified Nocardioides]GAW50331.1 DNA polymerase III, subunits gamma and tau (Frag ment) [Nocardioides sp. PD653-B2]GAW53053.1 DNA polymerase III, subunits gamma and tau (Frag ment) [Nocardioides sp. PD653]